MNESQTVYHELEDHDEERGDILLRRSSSLRSADEEGATNAAVEPLLTKEELNEERSKGEEDEKGDEKEDSFSGTNENNVGVGKLTKCLTTFILVLFVVVGHLCLLLILLDEIWYTSPKERMYLICMCIPVILGIYGGSFRQTRPLIIAAVGDILLGLGFDNSESFWLAYFSLLFAAIHNWQWIKPYLDDLRRQEDVLTISIGKEEEFDEEDQAEETTSRPEHCSFRDVVTDFICRLTCMVNGVIALGSALDFIDFLFDDSNEATSHGSNLPGFGSNQEDYFIVLVGVVICGTIGATAAYLRNPQLIGLSTLLFLFLFLAFPTESRDDDNLLAVLLPVCLLGWLSSALLWNRCFCFSSQYLRNFARDDAKLDAWFRLFLLLSILMAIRGVIGRGANSTDVHGIIYSTHSTRTPLTSAS